jgi:hypothetical protein
MNYASRSAVINSSSFIMKALVFGMWRICEG